MFPGFVGGGRGTYVLYQIAIFLWPHERFLRAAISASLLRKAISLRPLFFFLGVSKKVSGLGNMNIVEYEICRMSWSHSGRFGTES